MSCDDSCQLGVDGIPWPPPSDGVDALWSLDWSEQPSFDYKAAGDGTYVVDGDPVEMVWMDRADVYRNVQGTGLEVVASSGVSRTWGNNPSSPHHYFDLGTTIPALENYAAGRWWIFWWELAARDIPEPNNAVLVQCANKDTDYGATAWLGGGLRRGAWTDPATTWGGQVQRDSTSALVSNTPIPGSEEWRVLAVAVWGRLRSASVLGGPPDAWGRPERMFEIGQTYILNGTLTQSGSEFCNPWGGRHYFGVATQNTVGAPSATLRRQMITRGPLR